MVVRISIRVGRFEGQACGGWHEVLAGHAGGPNRTEIEQQAVPADHAERYQRVEHRVEQAGRLAGETAHEFAPFDRAEFRDPRHDLAGQTQPGGRQFLVGRALEELRGTTGQMPGGGVGGVGDPCFWRPVATPRGGEGQGRHQAVGMGDRVVGAQAEARLAEARHPPQEITRNPRIIELDRRHG